MRGSFTWSSPLMDIHLSSGCIDWLFFRYDLGSGQAHLVSPAPLELNKYHTVVAKRYGKDGRLEINGGHEVAGISPGTLKSLDLGTPLYIGKLPSPTEKWVLFLDVIYVYQLSGQFLKIVLVISCHSIFYILAHLYTTLDNNTVSLDFCSLLLFSFHSILCVKNDHRCWHKWWLCRLHWQPDHQWSRFWRHQGVQPGIPCFKRCQQSCQYQSVPCVPQWEFPHMICKHFYGQQLQFQVSVWTAHVIASLVKMEALAKPMETHIYAYAPLGTQVSEPTVRPNLVYTFVRATIFLCHRYELWGGGDVSLRFQPLRLWRHLSGPADGRLHLLVCWQPEGWIMRWGWAFSTIFLISTRQSSQVLLELYVT